MLTLPSITKMLFATLLVASIAACSAVPTLEAPANYLEDATITANVKSAIFEEPSLEAMQIGVETTKDVVLLSGVVDTHQARGRAGDLARGVAGVRSVRNDLTIG
jgi:osmotically-inducible protein OsmY